MTCVVNDPGFNPLFIGSKDATPKASGISSSRLSMFQSPFHRVKGCDACSSSGIGGGSPKVSIPFSSGQRMRLSFSEHNIKSLSSFNPLFIGSKDATESYVEKVHDDVGVSIPFSSGQRMRRGLPPPHGGRASGFQSPFHRVKGCDKGAAEAPRLRTAQVSIPFSSGQRMRHRQYYRGKLGLER